MRGFFPVSAFVRLRRGPRIALYSHDTVGLGHIRRNQLIARALAAPPLNASVLLITGVREGGAFAVPDGIDSLILPAYRKCADGTYSARSLDMTADQLTRLRADLIDTALLRFAPELFVADNVPRGARDELVPALRRMRTEGRTRCILGLRDILDDPAAVDREWRARDNFAAIRSFFDGVWVYGDSAVYDTAAEYGFPADVRAITRQVGYLNPCDGARPSAQPPRAAPADRRLILCSAGGGEDGFRLARRFCEVRFAADTRGIVVTGPLMARDKRRELVDLAASSPALDVIEAIYDPLPLIRQADGVVAMAGYNTVNEILALGKRALLVPRTVPRREQWLRAQRMAELGLVSTLADEDATPARIGQWIDSADVAVTAGERINFDGLGQIVRCVEAMVDWQDDALVRRVTHPARIRVAAHG